MAKPARPTVGGILAGMVMDVGPMLVSSGAPSGGLAGWAVEPKLDGWRARVHLDPELPGGLRVRPGVAAT